MKHTFPTISDLFKGSNEITTGCPVKRLFIFAGQHPTFSFNKNHQIYTNITT